jgi:hypothetical protein
VAHRLCRLTWKILHQAVRYVEYGLRPNPKAVRKRANKPIRDLKALGYHVQISPGSSLTPAI